MPGDDTCTLSDDSHLVSVILCFFAPQARGTVTDAGLSICQTGSCSESISKWEGVVSAVVGDEGWKLFGVVTSFSSKSNGRIAAASTSLLV